MKHEISSHAINQLPGLKIEQVVVKLHKEPCPNLNVINESIEAIVDIFLTEFRNFQSNRYCFGHPDQFTTKDAFRSFSYLALDVFIALHLSTQICCLQSDIKVP